MTATQNPPVYLMTNIIKDNLTKICFSACWLVSADLQNHIMTADDELLFLSKIRTISWPLWYFNKLAKYIILVSFLCCC